MTIKEKAEELYLRFSPHAGYKYDFDLDTETKEHEAKQCALIAVDEILKEHNTYYVEIGEDIRRIKYNYWQEVKREINNL